MRPTARKSAYGNEFFEPTQVKGSYHFRRAHLSLAVHAEQEFPFVGLVAEEVREDRTVRSKCLRPTMRSFAHGVFEMPPHSPQNGVGVIEISRDSPRALAA